MASGRFASAIKAATERSRLADLDWRRNPEDHITDSLSYALKTQQNSLNTIHPSVAVKGADREAEASAQLPDWGTW